MTLGHDDSTIYIAMAIIIIIIIIIINTTNRSWAYLPQDNLVSK